MTDVGSIPRLLPTFEGVTDEESHDVPAGPLCYWYDLCRPVRVLGVGPGAPADPGAGRPVRAHRPDPGGSAGHLPHDSPGLARRGPRRPEDAERGGFERRVVLEGQP